ncbi:MAG: DUF4062 domain-containing protein, partial [Planctomycetes bacterium]|nr:DUF4062 domain-containing protein [Planctomycetota bacterium]
MESFAVWKSRPVFVTSTFRDMHAERDHLRHFVFPVLEERLRERYHHLEPVDLRWGVETRSLGGEQAKELLVLKVCLAEIERCRPFLIALIGDRYGWVPPEDRMRAAAEEAGFAGAIEGRSVTALEIEYGVLASSDQKRRSRFYFRDPLPYEAMDPETAAIYSDAHARTGGAAEAAARLSALKDRIARAMPDRVRRYRGEWDAANRQVTGLEDWGQQVLEDLWQDLELETRDHQRLAVTTWQEQEARVLETFIEDQSRDFAGRSGIIDDIRRLALSPVEEKAQWGLCIAGEAGAGKSALFAKLCRVFRDEDVVILAHAAGISTRSTSVDSLLRRWIRELAGHVGIADPSETLAAREDLEKAFGELLSRLSARRRVICLMDALNQFERTPAARYLTWLPAVWPPNARFIAAAVPGTETEALARRPGMRIRDLAPLDDAEARQVGETVCRRYHKTLNPEILDALLAKRLPDGKPSAGNPLWLELALEDLLLLDADDFSRAEREYHGTPEERLHAMMLDVARALPPDIESLYGHMLERAEKIHGESWAREFANLIAASRSGWRESDLRPLMPARVGVHAEDPEPWDDLRFAGLRRAFRAHLVQRGAHGQWDFFHTQMRAAVMRRNLSDSSVLTALHTTIADHLESLPVEDPLRISELMVHLIRADERVRAAKHYGRSSLGAAERAGATRALAEHVLAHASEESNRGLEWALALLELPDLSTDEVYVAAQGFIFDLIVALENDARLPLRLRILEGAQKALQRLADADPSNSSWQRDLSVSHERIGDVLT